MNKLPLDEGRIKQKLKTRTSILKATKRLMKKSRKITLEDIAEEADISRATIYRYFSNVDLLVLEASLDIEHTSPDELSRQVEELEMTERLFFIQDHYNRQAQKHEIGFKRYLSAAIAESVATRKSVRGARRVESLQKSLEPLRENLTRQQFDNLVTIASVLMGIDAMIVTKDVCGLNNDQSSEVLKWGLEMILQGMQINS